MFPLLLCSLWPLEQKCLDLLHPLVPGNLHMCMNDPPSIVVAAPPTMTLYHIKHSYNKQIIIEFICLYLHAHVSLTVTGIPIQKSNNTRN